MRNFKPNVSLNNRKIIAPLNSSVTLSPNYTNAPKTYSENSDDTAPITTPNYKIVGDKIEDVPVASSITTPNYKIDRDEFEDASSITTENYDDLIAEDEIKKSYEEYRKKKVTEYCTRILSIFMNDEFIDGEISKSELYMEKHFNELTKYYILEALSKICIDHFNNPHILEGVLTMLSSVSYDDASPFGVTMCASLLEHTSLEVRDKAVQTFERWNSKKSISILENLTYSPKWFKRYVEEVISALKEGGND